MPNQLDKILIVNEDDDFRSLLREQVLDPRLFQVFEATDGAEGLTLVDAKKPDLIILDLNMPGLSGRDFLVALKSKGSTCPIIVSTKRGNEIQAIEAFRLGATDYLTTPLREAEALGTIEHGLQEVHLRRERWELMQRLEQSNKQLEGRLKALTTLSQIGRTVTSIFNLEQLFAKVLEAAIVITESDHSYLILYDEQSKRLILRSGKNMTLVMQERLGEAITDDLATLVMTSGEPLSAAGETLKRFKLPSDVYAVLYAPLIIQGKAIGVLAVGNHKKQQAFDKNMGSYLESLAGYAAIAIANARLFTALERRAREMERAYEELKTHKQ